MGYNFEIDPIVNSLKRERVITLYATDRTNNIQNINVPTNAVPLKVTVDQILRHANISKQLTPLYIELKFDNEVGTFVIGLENNFNDQDWCERILNSKKFPMELGSDGDATMLYNRRCGGDYTIDSAGRVQRG
jgi:hypothetical protein